MTLKFLEQIDGVDFARVTLPTFLQRTGINEPYDTIASRLGHKEKVAFGKLPRPCPLAYALVDREIGEKFIWKNIGICSAPSLNMNAGNGSYIICSSWSNNEFCRLVHLPPDALSNTHQDRPGWGSVAAF